MEGDEGQGRSELCVCRAIVFCSDPYRVNFVDSEGKSCWVRAQDSWEAQEKSEGVNNEPR